ncbi:Carbamoyl-phosphate synth [Mycena sanguinolenta]|uniref:Carbamoyl-phosphate synth n=1 Tax=Mycena sanguinolenta TaxID=230812 RepID=A0A8H7D754_9AGAR|nr:Carbamoyl-phosphate synth [Mycena sanguinolenta]
MSTPASQSSRNVDFEPMSHPENIVILPRTESPQPLSAGSGGDESGMRQMSGPSFLLPTLPEDARMPPTPGPGSTDQTGEPSPTAARSEFRSIGVPHRQSELDWIIPVDHKRGPRPKSLQERLDPTLGHAKEERKACEFKARMTGYALNTAIGLQVLLGALTTGVAAATSGRNTSIAISVLGGLATIVASYLARARGSNEPELSITRVKDLDQYIRECEIFILDHGHITSNEHDEELSKLRVRYEELLGNGNGERRLSSV